MSKRDGSPLLYSSSSSKRSKDSVKDSVFSCPSCTFFNSSTALKCSLCDTLFVVANQKENVKEGKIVKKIDSDTEDDDIVIVETIAKPASIQTTPKTITKPAAVFIPKTITKPAAVSIPKPAAVSIPKTIPKAAKPLEKRSAAHPQDTVPVRLVLAPVEETLNVAGASWSGKIEMTPTTNSRSKLTFQSLLQDGLEEGIVSSYCLDIEWISSLLPPRTKFTFCIPKPNDLSHAGIKNNSFQANEFIRLVFPPMTSGWGCMHIKLLCLFYKTHIRLVIPSANMVDYDWDRMENIVYYQDFPSLPSWKSHSPASESFLKSLQSVLRLMTLESRVIQRLASYDFDRAIGELVLSKPGPCLKTDPQMMGMLRLQEIAREYDIKVREDEPASIICQCSSVGAISLEWANQFSASLRGLEHNQKANASFKLCFPSLATVEKSCYGKNGAGTLFFSGKWNSPTFPKDLIYDCESKSLGALMHSKVIVMSSFSTLPSSTLQVVDKKDTNKDGMFYLGSHNHTAAAWGNFYKKKEGLTMKNWELGIVIPFRHIRALDSCSSKVEFSIPFTVPPRAYSNSDIPWIQNLHNSH